MDTKKQDFRKDGKKDPKGRKDFKDKKPYTKDVKDKDKKGSTFFTNDPAFYLLNPVLARNAARISFGNPAGLPVSLKGLYAGGATPNAITTGMDKKVANIACFSMLPTIGKSNLATDPINVAAKSIYSWVRHANSGHVNYDFPDLMIYLLAMREVYGFLGWMIRLSGLINKWSVENRNFPKTFFTIQGVDYESLLSNQANFRFYINSFAKRANAMSVPRKFPMYQKAFNMYANVFREGKCTKDQYYLYVPAAFLVYDPTLYTTGGCLKMQTGREIVGSGSGNLSYSDIVAIGDALLAPLLGDEDMGIMSGDIRKAFTAEQCYTLGTIDENIILEPVVDSYELQIIHNITLETNPILLTDSAISNKDGYVVQDANGVLTQQVFASTANNRVLHTDSNLIDIDSADPTIEEVIEASIYKVTSYVLAASNPGLAGWKAITGSTWAYATLHEFGDYVCTNMSILSDNVNIGYTAEFEWTPIDQVASNPVSGVYEYKATGQWHNFSEISGTVLANIHMSNLLSLYAIPAPEHLN